MSASLTPSPVGTELLDDPGADPAVVAESLRNISRSNRWFGGAAAVPGQVRIALQRFEVTPPTCAGWPDIQKNYVENGPLLPLGCVTNRNLQLMVEDPRDLIVGRSLGDADTGHQVDAVNRYRADKVKPFLSTTATGGNGASMSRQ